MLRVFYYIPLHGVLLFLLNILMYFDINLEKDLIQVPLLSRAYLPLNGFEIMALLGAIFLFIELLKSTQNYTRVVIEHIVSVVVLVFYIIEFLNWGKAGHFTFFLLTIFSFLDVAAGLFITLMVARRDFNLHSSLVDQS